MPLFLSLALSGGRRKAKLKSRPSIAAGSLGKFRVNVFQTISRESNSNLLFCIVSETACSYKEWAKRER
jgi:hypothetical protein